MCLVFVLKLFVVLLGSEFVVVFRENDVRNTEHEIRVSYAGSFFSLYIVMRWKCMILRENQASLFAPNKT